MIRHIVLKRQWIKVCNVSFHLNTYKLVECIDLDLLGDNIVVYGDWLPRHLSFTKSENNSATALCAMIRMCYLGGIICMQHILAKYKLLDEKYIR